jgi:hypothetical protein
MGQPVDDDVLDEFGAPGGSLDEFLAEEASTDENAVSTDEEQSELPVVHDFDPAEDRELTLYGAMRLATEAAVDALRGRLLSEQANAFRSYLRSFRDELTR